MSEDKERINLGSIDAACNKCDGKLNKGGIFEPSLDFFNITVKESKRKVYYFHTLLDFLGIDQYNKEGTKIIKRFFYHKECTPDNLKELVPLKEEINSYLSPKKPGVRISVEISKTEANKTKLGPKIKE